MLNLSKQFVVTVLAFFALAFVFAAQANAESTVYSNPETNIVLTYSEQTVAQGGGFVFGVQGYQVKLGGFGALNYSHQFGYLQLGKTKPQLTLHHPSDITVTGAQAVYRLANKYGRLTKHFQIINWTTVHPLQLYTKNALLIGVTVGLDDPHEPLRPGAM